MLILNRFARLALLHALLVGCTVPQPQTTPSASHRPNETSAALPSAAPPPLLPTDLQTQSADNPSGDDDAKDVTLPPPTVSPLENSCLDTPSDLLNSWLDILYRPSPGRLLRFAMRLSEASDDGVEKAIRIIEHAVKRSRDGNRSNPSSEFDDIYDFVLARLYENLNQIDKRKQNADSNKNFDLNSKSQGEGEENANPEALRKARDLYAKVAKFRRSPYYHLARAKTLELSVLLGDVDAGDLADFIETYPDYPRRLALKFEWAQRLYDTDATDSNAQRDKNRAVETMQSLAFWYPKDAVAKRARAWLDERQIESPPRPYKDVYKRVDDLRKIRFWDEAEAAANEALSQYPDDVPLLVESGRIAYERSDHALAIERFEKLFDFLDGQTIDKVRPNGVRGYITRAYAYHGNCKKALEVFDDYVAHYGKTSQIEAKRDFALACGDIDTAYRLAKELRPPRSASAMYEFAFIAYLARDYSTARRYYTAAVREMSGTYKRRATYFLAQATLKAAQQALADASVDAGQTTTQGDDATDSPKKKTSKRSSKKKKATVDQIVLDAPTIEEAKRLFQSIIDENSDDYYAILAWSRLDELSDRPVSSTLVIGLPNENYSRSTAKARPNENEYAFDERELVANFDENVEKFASIIPELKRVQFLHHAELYRERNALFRHIAIEVMGISRLSRRPALKNLWTTKLSLDGHLVDNRRNDTGVWGMELSDYVFDLPALKQTAQRQKILERQTAIYDRRNALRDFVKNTLIGFHDYYLSRRYTSSPRKTCGSPDNSRECSIFYPHAYSQAVCDAARKNGIHPELVWAIMNIESAFNPDSISHANAYGLLQIIPMTGYKIADALDVDGFGPYDLVKPEVSIEMGSWYFAQILHKFHGYATLSMAAYNGGPHQVARWLTAYAGKIEHDAFVELIPYNEARNYVKKGMARLLIFERIDHADPEMFFAIPNTLPLQFEEMPNY